LIFEKKNKTKQNKNQNKHVISLVSPLDLSHTWFSQTLEENRGHSPEATHKPGKLQQAGVGGEPELSFRQGQLAVLKCVVGH
jgi:hypothetical protein